MNRNYIVAYELYLFLQLIQAEQYRRLWADVFIDSYARARQPLRELPGAEVYQISDYQQKRSV